jgi:hypothetical protein
MTDTQERQADYQAVRERIQARTTPEYVTTLENRVNTLIELAMLLATSPDELRRDYGPEAGQYLGEHARTLASRSGSPSLAREAERAILRTFGQEHLAPVDHPAYRGME